MDALTDDVHSLSATFSNIRLTALDTCRLS